VLVAAAILLLTVTWMSPLSAAIIVPKGELPPREQAYTLLQLKRYQDAKKLLDSVLAETPDDGIALHYRGMARYHLEDYNGAIGDYYEALKRRPKDADILTSLAIVRHHTGDSVKAAAYLEQALKKDPNNTKAMNQLAWILAVSPSKQLRDGNRAVKLAEKLVAQKENAHTLDTLAAAYAANGQFDMAISTQKKVIAILVDENQTNQLSRYLARLEAYEAHKAWQPEKSKNGKKETGQKEEDETEVKTEPEEKAALDQQAEPIDKETDKQKPAVQEKPAPATKSDADQKDVSTPSKSVSKAEPAPSKPVTSTVEAPAKNIPAPPKTEEKPPAKAEAASAYHPYTIQIASFKDRNTAYRKAKEFREKGDPAFTAPIFIEPSGVWHRLFYGWFKTAEEAAKTAQLLKNRNFRKTFIVKKPYTILMAESSHPELLDRIEQRLIHLGHMPYQLPDPANPQNMRLLIGAYSDKLIPQELRSALKKEGYEPKAVLR
jgi:tetratricopeptide (TPR) repeat protein